MEEMLEEAYNKLKGVRHTNDKGLYVNLYNMREDLKSETPQTETGRNTIISAIIKLNIEMFDLLVSLERRNMI